MAHHEPSKLSYQLLKQITNDFDEERILGTGGFGTVYKGVYENGGEIAVKVLHNISRFDDKEFRKEFDNLRGLKHPNIVKLLSFCNESEKELAVFEGKQVIAERLRLALCFEYVQNGNLSKVISDEHTGLSWHTRYKIIKGICEGLKYLREGLEYPIMHFDLKPDNILLDKSMVPKIADFGLSKLFGEENTRIAKDPAGTWGYCPPEYITRQIISRHFDIYSLGVIIVRIMTGHQSYNSVVELPKWKSVRLVHANWRERLRGTLSHTSLEVHCNQDIVSRLNETEILIGDQGSNETEIMIGEHHSNETEITMQNEQLYYGHDEPSSSTHSNNYLSATESVVMAFQELHRMTDGFSEKRLLGRGHYGTVYKAVLDNGEVIAVKKLRNQPVLFKDRFKYEFLNLARVQHQNVIRLVSYCVETRDVVAEHEGELVVTVEQDVAVCSEFMPGGTLEELLSDESCRLDWKESCKIIKGICQGLKYLHTGCKPPIYHLDLRPTQILLDKDCIPKIGDFGLFRLFSLTGFRQINSRTL